MAYKVVFKKTARKELYKLDKQNYQKIRARIDNLARNPRPSNSRKLRTAASLWRLRAGDYRVIYDIQDKKLVVLIVRVRHRSEVYKGLS